MKKWLEAYDESIAQQFLEHDPAGKGLPGYLGIRLDRFEPGRLFASLEVREDLFNPFGNLHGGVLAGLCDHLLGCVCYPHIRPGQWAATTEFKLNYLAPVTAGRLEAVAELVSMTRTTAVVRIDVHHGDRLACAAQGTCLIRDPK